MKKYRLNSFLACKTNKRTEKEATKELYTSLDVLKTDYLDLYQLHAMENDDDFEQVMADDGAIKTLQKAKEKGLVTTATVKMPFSLHALAIVETAPVPVPPPIPAAIKTYLHPEVYLLFHLKIHQQLLDQYQVLHLLLNLLLNLNQFEFFLLLCLTLNLEHQY